MSSIAFDTHAAANTFEEAGFTKAQVEALVEIARRTTALPDISTLATKTDLSALEATLRGEIATAKLQAITIILSGMAVITAAGALLGRLIR